MPEIQFREALRQAMTEEMERDENVFLMGEEVGEYNGAYKVSEGMLAKFGPRRVFDTPISEAGFSGLGVGAAMTGLRPIIEYMSWSFSWVAIDQLVNNAANVRYMSGGQFKVPIVFRGGNGIAHQLGATHSHRMESVYARIPGLIVVAPSTPADAKGLLKASIRCDDPVIFLENEKMLNDLGEVPEEDYTIPLGKAKIDNLGVDVVRLGQLLRGFQDHLGDFAPGDQRDVVTALFHVGFADRDREFAVGDLAAIVQHHFGFEKNDRIVAADGALEQALCIVGG